MQPGELTGESILACEADGFIDMEFQRPENEASVECTVFDYLDLWVPSSIPLDSLSQCWEVMVDNSLSTRFKNDEFFFLGSVIYSSIGLRVQCWDYHDSLKQSSLLQKSVKKVIQQHTEKIMQIRRVRRVIGEPQDQDIQWLKNEFKELRKDNKRIEKELKALESKGIEKELKELREEYKMIEKELKELREENKIIEKELQELREENEELREEIKWIKKELEETKMSKKELLKLATQQTIDKEKAQARSSELELQLHEYQSHNAISKKYQKKFGVYPLHRIRYNGVKWISRESSGEEGCSRSINRGGQSRKLKMQVKPSPKAKKGTYTPSCDEDNDEESDSLLIHVTTAPKRKRLIRQRSDTADIDSTSSEASDIESLTDCSLCLSDNLM